MTSPSLARRSVIAVAGLIAVLALLLSACGSSSSDGAAAGGDPYTVKHAMGSTELPGVPERIVVLDSPHLDALVSLGITPVGAPEVRVGEGFPAYLADKLTGTESIGGIAEPDIDAIANLAPDLIIGAKVRHEAVYDQLSAIAPTVFSENSGTDWTEQATITAAAVDKTDEMADLLRRLDQRAVEVGEKVGAKGKTASIVRFRPDNFRLYGPHTFSGSLLTKMGFELGERNWNEYSMMELSPELYEQIDGDVAFYMSPGGNPDASSQKTITQLWSGIPAVKANKAFEVEDDTWMVGIGVTGAGLVLDQVEDLLA
ncbi:ABC transporter substrate-binding protein [Gordonia phthalatica]|uniref:Iron siderophore-binding protein n=1 Tax=Gordonia phthalatica TaxID=1136941 RepID=A0A0N9NCS5_9ACTN|nr:iron-siderophore ABC transporter substrate-binding protein [Gordonia phthalatica]ALG84877.1 iron siderophore-binding protein [Gordonia phthalatica]